MSVIKTWTYYTVAGSWISSDRCRIFSQSNSNGSFGTADLPSHVQCWLRHERLLVYISVSAGVATVNAAIHSMPVTTVLCVLMFLRLTNVVEKS